MPPGSDTWPISLSRFALAAMNDGDEPTRMVADRVLRELTDNPASVGYDAK